MIIRAWRGRAGRARAGSYPKHFHEAVVPELRQVPGFLGAQLGRRVNGDAVEFLVLTRWETMEAILLCRTIAAWQSSLTQAMK